MLNPVIIIGDSLACPRPWAGVNLKQTYSALLQERLGGSYFIANWGISDNSSQRASADGHLNTYVKGSEAEVAIVQLGIVDCAPRLMSAVERVIGGLAARLPLFRSINKYYIKFKSKHRYKITKRFPKTLVTLESYQENMSKLVDALLELPSMNKVILINVAAPGDYLLNKSYGILDNVKAYNEVLNGLANQCPDRVTVVDLFTETEENPEWITADDGHHILAPAHAWLAEKIGTVVLESELD